MSNREKGGTARGLTHRVAVLCCVFLWACGDGPTQPTPPPASLPAPTLDSPPNGAEIGTLRPTLTVNNVVSAGTGARTYEYQVAQNSSFAEPVVSQSGIAEGGEGRTSYTLAQDLAPSTQYYWRARVAQGGNTSSWSDTAGFRTTRNRAPAISSLSARGSRPNEPVNFADADEEITVTAVVEDPDTPASQLTYEWRADAGTFSGSGASVTWRAPVFVSTPGTVTITLTVRDGSPATAAATSKPLSIRVHDSKKEVGDLATQFLTDFSNSTVAPEVVVRNFTDSCPGSRDELSDVEHNRRCYRIDSHDLGVPDVTVNFDGRCAFRDRPGDACATVNVEWRSTTISSAEECGGQPVGTRGVALGVDWIAAVYENSRWWLCSSDFEGRTASSRLFKR